MNAHCAVLARICSAKNNIPYKYIAINLQNHIPILYIFVSYSVCGALQLIDCMTRKSFNSKSKLNFRRIAIFYLSSFNGIYHFLKFSFLVKSWVAIGITFLLEIIAVLFEKGYIGFNKKRDILIDVYESVHKKIGRFVLFDCGIIIIALLLTFIYNVGDNTAKTQKEFEFLIHNESCYVVIADYKDKGIIQKAEVIKDKLVIDASKYHLISKDNIAIEYREFEKVTVKGAK